MPKKDNESYLNYKKRVIDPVSDSFCGAKWLNTTIWLTNGKTASCHHPLHHSIPLEEVEKNPAALHNTTFKKIKRLQMLKGIRPTECEYCWRIEDMGPDFVSDRVFKTVIYSDDDLKQLANLPWTADVIPKTMELAFDRACNFACAYCNASFSTQWEKDIKKNGPYENLGNKNHYLAFNAASDMLDPDNNPYIDAFWKWWPELTLELEELRLTGGEPLLSQQTWKLLDYFEKHPETKMRLAINSNLGLKLNYMEKLAEKSQYVKDLHLYTSLESFGKEAEYARDGLNFSEWQSNVEYLVTHAKLSSLNIMMTVNVLSVFSTVEFLEWLKEFKSRHGRGMGVISVNILRIPDFLNITTLPDHILFEYQEKLVRWYRANETSELFVDFELESIRRLIDYITEVTQPMHNYQPRADRMVYFKRFILEFDRRRQKSYKDVFPAIFSDWLESVPK